VVCPKRNQLLFLKHLLTSLQFNKTYLFQSTPILSIHCFQCSFHFWNTFCRIASRSIVNIFHLFYHLKSANFQSEFQTGGKGVCRGQVWRVRWLEDNSHLVLCQKFTGEEQRVSRCVVVVQHPGLVSPPSGLFLCSVSVKHFMTSMQNFLLTV
jgi:hypothetical protein